MIVPCFKVFTRLFLPVLLVSLLFALPGNAQDAQFSQYFANPLYLNPALAGSEECHRLNLGFRNQWTSMPGPYTTFSASYDAYIKKAKSGIGLIYINDFAGVNTLKTTSLNLVYSYHLQLNKSWQMNSGISGGFVRQAYDLSQLTFGDQIQNEGNIQPTAENLKNAVFVDPDLSFGVVVHNKSVWVSGAAKHINREQHDILGGRTITEYSFASIAAGFTIPIRNVNLYHRDDDVPSMSPSVMFRKQSNFIQLDMGLSFDFLPITIGAYYRGIPIVSNGYRTVNQDAAIFLIGFTADAFKMGYSYDVPVSQVGPVYGGSHEITAAYLFNSPRLAKKRKDYQSLPCPRF
ncbi:MAG: PorP/SprF family type IX secretion system membrane protein [Bacteroidota bacterium]